MGCGERSVFMKAKIGQTLPSREQHRSVSFNLPNLSPPTLAILCPVISLLYGLTVQPYRRSSSQGFISARCHPVATPQTELLRKLICLFGRDGTRILPTHHSDLLSLPITSYAACPLEHSSLLFLVNTHFLGVLCMSCTCAQPCLRCCGMLYLNLHDCEHLQRHFQGFREKVIADWFNCFIMTGPEMFS